MCQDQSIDLTYKAQNDGLRVVEDFSLDAPKTREVAALLKNHGLAEKKVLLLTGAYDEVLYRSGRNIPKLKVRNAAEASTLDLMDAQVVLLQEGALEALTRVLGPTEAAEAVA